MRECAWGYLTGGFWLGRGEARSANCLHLCLILKELRGGLTPESVGCTKHGMSTTNEPISSSELSERFATWIRELGNETLQLALLLEESNIPHSAKLLLAGALNYLFRSSDLIPDGIEEIGYLDDAFVLRVGALLAKKELSQSHFLVDRLAEEANLIRDFLGEMYSRLEHYVSNLQSLPARGRKAQDIIEEASQLAGFIAEVRAFANEYEPTPIGHDQKSLLRLRAFFDAKLPPVP